MPGILETVRNRLRQSTAHDTSGPLGLGLLGPSGGILSAGGSGIVGSFRAGLATSPLLNPPEAAASAVQKWNSSGSPRTSALGAEVPLPDVLGPNPLIYRDQRRVRLAATPGQPARPGVWAPQDSTPGTFEKSDRRATGSNSPTGGVDDRSFATKVVANGEAYAVSSPTYSPAAPPGLAYR